MPCPAVLAPGDEVAKVIKPPNRDGGDGRATEASVLSDGRGDLEVGREIAGSVVSSLQLLGAGLGG